VNAPTLAPGTTVPGTTALWHRSSRALPPRPVHVVQLLPVKVRVLDLVESTTRKLIFRDVSPANLTAKALLLAVLLSAAFGSTVHAQEDAPHPMRLVNLAVEAPGSARVPTHVVFDGTVELNRREKDGDRHLRVCDGGLCIVVECIPELPDVCAAAHKGDRVWVTGITRYDGWPGHGWWELHPVTALEVK